MALLVIIVAGIIFLAFFTLGVRHSFRRQRRVHNLEWRAAAGDREAQDRVRWLLLRQNVNRRMRNRYGPPPGR
jgi:hypothetical protein